MTCYSFSVRPTIPESRNVKVAIDEEENEDFCEEEYFNFEELSFSGEKTFRKNFCGIDGVSFTKLKTNFRKIFIKAFSSQYLENSGF